jgi:hypothetical protein
MQRLIPFGDAYIDPELIAWIKLSQTTHVKPAPGQTQVESAGGHGFAPLYVVQAAMAFSHASPIYASLGYNNKADAAALAESLVVDAQDNTRGQAFFAQLGDGTTWVRPDYVGSIATAAHEVTLWLNLPAATGPNLKFTASDAQSARALAVQYATWLSHAALSDEYAIREDMAQTANMD